MKGKGIIARLITIAAITAISVSFSIQPVLVKAAELLEREENNQEEEAEPEQTEGWKGSLYYIVQDGQAIVTDCKENVKKVTIPAKFQGYPVTAIGEEAFAWCSQFTKLTIPKNIKTIGKRAFFHASGLGKITFEGKLTELGQEAFAYCYSLRNIELPKGLTALPYRLFYQCLKLQKVSISKGVTSIGSEVFGNCPNLKAVLLPKTFLYDGSSSSFDMSKSYVLYTATEQDALYQKQDSLNETDPFFNWWFGGSYFGGSDTKMRVHFLPIAKALSVDQTKKGVIALNWKSRGNQIAGYEVEYTKDKAFEKGVKTVKRAVDKANLKGVKSGETWYVRVRAYETCSGLKIYGNYSKVKEVVVP